MIVRATYSKTNPDTYTVHVIGGTVDGTEFSFNQVATLTANPAPQGQFFHHWKVDGVIVSYQSTVSFTVLENSEWVAVYHSVAPSVSPRVFLGENLGLRAAEFKRTYVGRLEVPAGFELIETGLLTHPDRLAELTIATAGATRRISKKQTIDTREFMMSMATGAAQTVRAYLIVKNSEGNLQTVYDEAIYQVRKRRIRNRRSDRLDAVSIVERRVRVIGVSHRTRRQDEVLRLERNQSLQFQRRLLIWRVRNAI
ncbi:MAG: hypothetical protein MZU97_01265 [Bacillus subtilis]|nr:hypothetical protein [Bacillus subtilis]